MIAMVTSHQLPPNFQLVVELNGWRVDVVCIAKT